MIIDELIYDRTEADLEIPKACKKQNIPYPSDNLRYSWDYRALNRTEQAMEYLNQIFKELGYFKTMEFKTNWTDEEITPEQANRYINNLRTLREFIIMESTTPVAPNTINGMSIDRANDIEKILELLDVLIGKIEQAYLYSGEIHAGEV